MSVFKNGRMKSPGQAVPDNFCLSQTLHDGTRVVTDPKNDIKFLRCAGLDVHKSTIMAAVCITDPQTLHATYYVREFSTMNSDIHRLVRFLKQYEVLDVCMESTGKYWIPIYDTLAAQGLKPVLTHPKYVKQIAGKKTDFKDAINIANMFRSGRVTPSFVPPQDIRDLREILRYQLKLIAVRTGEKNRMQNCMTISRLRIDSVFSDPFGLSSTRVLEYLLYTDPKDVRDDEIISRVDPRVKASHEEILDSIHGYGFLSPVRAKMKIILNHMKSINDALKQIDTELLAPYKKKYRDAINRIKTIPGISDTAALYILSEIGTDMSVWNDDAQLARWAGLAPGNKSSGKKDKKTRTSNGGHVLVPILVQCALASLKDKKTPYFAIKYENIKARRGHKRAIIAVARMMLVAIYQMLTKGEDFNPADLQKVLAKSHNKKIRKDDVLAYLKEQGIAASTLEDIRNQLTSPASQKREKPSPKKKSSKTTKKQSSTAKGVSSVHQRALSPKIEQA